MDITYTCNHINYAFLYSIFMALTCIHFMTWWGVNFHEHRRGKTLCVQIILITLSLGDCKIEHEIDSKIGAVYEVKQVLYLIGIVKT